MMAIKTKAEQLLNDWHVLPAALLAALLQLKPFALTRLQLRGGIGRINGRGKYFSGKWYAAPHTNALLTEGQASLSAITTTTGTRLQAHYVMVSAVARWLLQYRPSAEVYPEMVLRRRLGWMEKGRAWGRNCFITPVPDLLMQQGEQIWRVEVQLQRRHPDYWLKRIGGAPDLHHVLITGPLTVVRPLWKTLPRQHAGRKIRVLEYFTASGGLW
ncbi:MAG: hypothetical protein LBK60_11290 [Verrucomicrobiales bacterium]|nr:hypothetical protein [Verrucomicrobiales bacterium]